MSEEIELKLTIAASDHRRLLAHPLLRGASARTDQILDNHYYDTPALALRARGVALRIRRQGRSRLQTIKLTTGQAAICGLSVRPEWEQPFRRQFDFSAVQPPALRAWLQQTAVAGQVRPMFRTRFRRITWTLPLADGGEVLVAFDRGEVSPGAPADTRRTLISEVELELAGSRDTDALLRLARQLGERVPSLTPSDLSKAQRGYALLAPVIGASSQ